MRISDWSSDVCSSDLDEILNFDPNQSRELLKLELLKFHRSATSLKSDRADVLMLAQRIISPAELSERSGRSSQSVVVELKRFNIPRIAFGWDRRVRSEEHTSELTLLMRITYVVCCMKKKQVV